MRPFLAAEIGERLAGRAAAGLRAATLPGRQWPGDAARTTLPGGIEDPSLGTIRADTITLFQSRLSPLGPTDVPLVRTPLAGRQ